MDSRGLKGRSTPALSLRELFEKAVSTTLSLSLSFQELLISGTYRWERRPGKVSCAEDEDGGWRLGRGRRRRNGRLIVYNDSRATHAGKSQLSSVRRYWKAQRRRLRALLAGSSYWSGADRPGSGCSGVDWHRCKLYLCVQRASVCARGTCTPCCTHRHGTAAAHIDVARIVTRNFVLLGETLK